MNIVIYGNGNFAEYVEYLISNDSEDTVCAFCVEKQYMEKRVLNGHPVIDFNTIEKNYPPEEFNLFIAIGLNRERQRIFDLAKMKGYKMTNYISSKATTWNNLKIGENTWVGEGSIIQPFVTIDDNSILFAATLGHHSSIKNHCLVSGATLGGNVIVGDFSILGLNSSVKQNVQIGEYNIIGMGCNIDRNTDDYAIYHHGKTTLKRNFSSKKIEMKYLK